METFQYTITDEIGIHARPAGELAKRAKEIPAESTRKKEKKKAGKNKRGQKEEERKESKEIR